MANRIKIRGALAIAAFVTGTAVIIGDLILAVVRGDFSFLSTLVAVIFLVIFQLLTIDWKKVSAL